MTNNKKELKKLEGLLKRVANHKPKEVPKKPKKQPNRAELEKVYVMFDGLRIEEV